MNQIENSQSTRLNEIYSPTNSALNFSIKSIRDFMRLIKQTLVKKIIRFAFIATAIAAMLFATHAANAQGTLTPIGPTNSFSTAESHNMDATVIVGKVWTSLDQFGQPVNPEAYRWTQASGMVTLGTLPGCTSSVATDVTMDGLVVFGTSSNGTGTKHVFRWTQATGMVQIDDFPSNTWVYIYYSSSDGSALIGNWGDSSWGDTGFYWSQSTGMFDLQFPGETSSYASDMSQDGATVVGTSGTRAFRWTKQTE